MVEHRAEVTIPCPLDHVYRLFTQFEEFPKFMSHVKEVRRAPDGTHSHWRVDLLGMHEWNARHVGWEPNRRIGWQSTSGIQNEGEVLFEEVGPRSTRVIAVLRYAPPGGDATEALISGGAVERALRLELEHFAKMARGATIEEHPVEKRVVHVVHSDRPYYEEASVPGDDSVRTAVDPALVSRVRRGTIEGVSRSTSDDSMHRPFEPGTTAP